MFWQGIDPIAAIRVLGDSIFHVHAKDTQIYDRNLPKTGVLDTKKYTDERNRGWIFRTCGYGHGAEMVERVYLHSAYVRLRLRALHRARGFANVTRRRSDEGLDSLIPRSFAKLPPPPGGCSRFVRGGGPASPVRHRNATEARPAIIRRKLRMDFVDHLKSSVDIVRTVGEYVRLRKVRPATPACVPSTQRRLLRSASTPASASLYVSAAVKKAMS